MTIRGRDGNDPQLDETSQRLVAELRRMTGQPEWREDVALALRLFREYGYRAAADAFLAGEHEAAFAEDEARDFAAWDAHWTGVDDEPA